MDLYTRLAASSITFRDEPLDSALHRLRALGFARLDLTAIRHYCDHFDPLLVDVGEEVCLRTRDLIARYDFSTISLTTYPANPLAKDLNGGDWADGVDAYVRLGIILGARTLILPPGQPAPAADRWRGTAVHALPWQREAARRVENARMQPVIALQSDSLLRTTLEGLAFLHVLDKPHVGLAVDPAHFAAMGEDPVDALRRLGAAVAFVLLRDSDGSHFNLPPGSGRLDYPAILSVLDDIGYAGPLVLAIDDITLPPAARADLLKRGMDYLDGLAQRKAA